jgi:hydroxyethylthiazole kinase-like uncharacterized protein yjeF
MQDLSPDLLRLMPLPSPDGGEDKNDRGIVLVIGSSAMVPGAALLSVEAALRGGAGKVQAAVPRALSSGFGLAVPESAVIGLSDDFAADSALGKALRGADAILVGPGIMNGEAAAAYTRASLVQPNKKFVLDAGALEILRPLQNAVESQSGNIVLTPHAGEMAQLLDRPKSRIEAEPVDSAIEAARQYQAVVALKGAITYIATPKGELYRNICAASGLGTGGSGDVLAGLIVAFLARGAAPLTAALWGVYVHSRAGEELAGAVGTLGFLGREIPARVPAILDKLSAEKPEKGLP